MLQAVNAVQLIEEVANDPNLKKWFAIYNTYFDKEDRSKIIRNARKMYFGDSFSPYHRFFLAYVADKEVVQDPERKKEVLPNKKTRIYARNIHAVVVPEFQEGVAMFLAHGEPYFYLDKVLFGDIKVPDYRARHLEHHMVSKKFI